MLRSYCPNMYTVGSGQQWDYEAEDIPARGLCLNYKQSKEFCRLPVYCESYSGFRQVVSPLLLGSTDSNIFT